MPFVNILGVDFFNESFHFPKIKFFPKKEFLAKNARNKTGTKDGKIVYSLFGLGRGKQKREQKLLCSLCILRVCYVKEKLPAAESYSYCVRCLVKPLFEHALRCIRTIKSYISQLYFSNP